MYFAVVKKPKSDDKLFLTIFLQLELNVVYLVLTCEGHHQEQQSIFHSSSSVTIPDPL